ncbi:TetR/AcrR family transcriptional regulator [Saccharomonospora sp. NPDC046836]|uniref:TetR/AcrR family transcriptional regulator n=1 Tax=Saccharomonospora sp. NPDC046836 TaxID=3156921 RepID=UPI0033F4FEFA
MNAEPGWAMHMARYAVPPAHDGYLGPRTKLITAGQRLLLERGDSSYTIEELVRRAGVAIKTFYRCFQNKEEFLLEVFTTSVSGAAPRIRQYIVDATDDPLARLRMVVTWPLEWHPEAEPLSRAVATEHMRITMTSPETIAATRKPYEAVVRELIADAAEAGLVAPTDLEWDAHLITSMVTSAYHTLVLGLGEPDAATLADNVWRFCLTALNGPG